MLEQKHLILPSWPAPENVKVMQTTRMGGVSAAPFDGLNLADHVHDNAMDVARNRQLLNTYVPSEPVWLKQVHGVSVVDAATVSCIATADAAYTNNINVVCVVMTADCLPILLCDRSGTVVAAVHAGWRGLCDGVIEATVKAMSTSVSEIIVWLGPAIGPNFFEVGDDVRTKFIEYDPQAEHAFKPFNGKWLADLYLLAKQRLQSLGVSEVYGDVHCTYSHPEQFYSFRRDGDTGRMATMIWLRP